MFVRLCIFQENYSKQSKQKALDPDPRAIQQIVFQRVVWGDNNRTLIRTLHHYIH